MMSSPSTFLWSDVWLLTSICLAGPRGSAVSLETIIGVGDGINHAIFTPSEVNGGFSRLQRAGIIRVHEDGCSLTPAGEKLVTPSLKKPLSLAKRMEHIRKQLGAEDWKPGTDPHAADDAETEVRYVDDAMFDAAYKAYKNSMKRTKKKK
ncbi:hypothetical protein DES53_10487 [Roseimicrobium gellanilyticum]|uniref:Uncharacterized protein n=1 Tax=Roseimicrobium gellanilyticum TaxID=748857 RepID=A0A366HM92_9BACT|nr:hypothetical protein [Roseimicrobium gellanilyticum]RBP44268.1 hypothetical protein DES53_10487 [Roseimicrobium gellanilyticum]